MEATPEQHDCSHFSLSNPRGRHQGNMPRLLRRLATEIVQLGDNTMILDVVIKDEVDDLGSCFTATVDYNAEGWVAKQ